MSNECLIDAAARRRLGRVNWAMGYGNYTILYETGGIHYKICKILFGADGSYYVTSPYHPAQKAAVMKMTVNYSQREILIPYEELIDTASADDDEKRLKLSHHPSGFIQFSGEGILSGKNPDGSIKGVGVESWPLNDPVAGPSFGITLLGVDQFAQAAKIKGDSCIFSSEEFTPVPGGNGFLLEGFYFPSASRRFVVTEPDGSRTISLVHPTGTLLRLKALLASETCTLPGLIGLTLYPETVNFDGNAVGFMLSSSTGNIRFNEQGDKLGDGLFCAYPRPSTIPIKRSLDYPGPSTRTGNL